MAIAPIPPLLKLADEVAYRQRFLELYCGGPITTFDGILVRFRHTDFDHCCYGRTRPQGPKDKFASLRAERLEWIEIALKSASSDRFVGWDSASKCYDKSRRVTLVFGDFVVVIAMTKKADGTKPAEARFITAYIADSTDVILKIRQGPRWPN